MTKVTMKEVQRHSNNVQAAVKKKLSPFLRKGPQASLGIRTHIKAARLWDRKRKEGGMGANRVAPAEGKGARHEASKRSSCGQNQPRKS